MGNVIYRNWINGGRMRGKHRLRTVAKVPMSDINTGIPSWRELMGRRGFRKQLALVWVIVWVGVLVYCVGSL